jgi:hypothetical protein
MLNGLIPIQTSLDLAATMMLTSQRFNQAIWKSKGGLIAMQRTIDDFSLQAYIAMQDKLDANQTIVLDVYKANPEGMTDRNVADHLRWKINQVTSRITELIELNKLVYLGSSGPRMSGRPGRVLAWIGDYPELSGNAQKMLFDKRLRKQAKLLRNHFLSVAMEAGGPTSFASPFSMDHHASDYNNEVIL